MYTYDEISHVHLEPSTRCNAACPMCPRNMLGRTSPGLALTSLTLRDVRKIFARDFASRLEGVDFCGAYGDPVLAPQLAQIVAYFRECRPEGNLVVFSNGGIRRPQWWAELAKIIGRPGRVIFGVDGIGDTNAVYRRRVRFETVMDNARAFIDAGGEAQWDFLIFRHNEHQLDEARELSQKLGFAVFQPKKTGRFVRSAMEYVPELDGLPDTEHFPVLDPDGELVGHLEPPREAALRNEAAATLLSLSESPDGVLRMLDSTPIVCRVNRARSVFVGAQGYAFPCCQSYTAATLPGVYGRPPQADTQLEDLILAHGGFDAINTLKIGLRAAVEGEVMRAMEESWSKETIDEGKLKVCARVCGTRLGTFEKQFASAELVPGRQGTGVRVNL